VLQLLASHALFLVLVLEHGAPPLRPRPSTLLSALVASQLVPSRLERLTKLVETGDMRQRALLCRSHTERAQPLACCSSPSPICPLSPLGRSVFHAVSAKTGSNISSTSNSSWRASIAVRCSRYCIRIRSNGNRRANSLTFLTFSPRILAKSSTFCIARMFILTAF